MKFVTKKSSKEKEYARLSMKILRMKRSGEKQEKIKQLLNERETLKVRVGERDTQYNIQPRIIVGTSEFKTLRLENAIIVDKSLLIKAVLEAPSEVSLIARPRRWGKSLNLDMLKTFLEIEVNEKGEALPIDKRINHKLFTGSSLNPQPLKISAKQWVMNEQGKYPVILLNLRETKGTNYKEVEEKIIKRIGHTYYEHIYLINSDKLEKNEKELFQKYLRGKINKADLEESLYFLSILLHKQFNEKVYVLIDEYDEAITSSYVRFGHKPEEFGRLLDLIGGILGLALKQNQYLKKGVLTGVLRIAKASLFSSLNNISEYSLLDEEFSEYYGFNQEEVDELLNKAPNLVDRNSIREWYNGYTFGERTVYNPFSVMKCLSERGKFDTYWLDSGSTELIDQAMLSDDNQIEMQDLLCGKSVIKRIYKQIAFNQIREKKDLFYSLLVFAGYLNPTPIETDVYKLSIPPNQEIRQIYEDRIIEWVTNKLNISISDYDNFIGLLLEKKIEKFEEKLNYYLLNSTSYHDLKKERDYHNLMGGLLAPLSKKYNVDSNKESGDGRYDHILVPKVSNSNDTAFILEYKSCQKDNELENKAEAGLNQIDEKRYDTEARKNSQVKKIVKLCLAFGRKRAMGKHKIEELY
jgi:hypothetical protein